jgi:hypothetical protein
MAIIQFKSKDKYGRDTFVSIDDLVYYEIYIKLNKAAKMYRSPGDNREAWQTQGGAVVGKLYSFRYEGDNLHPSVNGVWFVFKDANYISYYWKYQSGGVVDWQHIENQLTEIEKNKLGWFDGWWKAAKDSFSETTDNIFYNYLKPFFYYALGGAVVYFGGKMLYNRYKESKERKELANDIAEQLKTKK